MSVRRNESNYKNEILTGRPVVKRWIEEAETEKALFPKMENKVRKEIIRRLESGIGIPDWLINAESLGNMALSAMNPVQALSNSLYTKWNFRMLRNISNEFRTYSNQVAREIQPNYKAAQSQMEDLAIDPSQVKAICDEFDEYLVDFYNMLVSLRDIVKVNLGSDGLKVDGDSFDNKIENAMKKINDYYYALADFNDAVRMRADLVKEIQLYQMIDNYRYYGVVGEKNFNVKKTWNRVNDGW